MLPITEVDHLGLRISDIERARAFYEQIGFELIRDTGFADGHPVVMKHASGVVVNLLGPSNAGEGTNILMDVDEKYTGYTHAALRVESIEATVAALEEMGIEITGGPMRFNAEMQSMFIRDPDGNVIELTTFGPRSRSRDSGNKARIRRAPVSTDPKHVFLIDGSGFIFRAFHALPPMTRPDGTPVNAVFGFTKMLMKMVDDTEADYVAVILR